MDERPLIPPSPPPPPSDSTTQDSSMKVSSSSTPSWLSKYLTPTFVVGLMTYTNVSIAFRKTIKLKEQTQRIQHNKQYSLKHIKIIIENHPSYQKLKSQQVLNYADRMIVSGAPNELQTFVHETLGVSVTSESVYLGYLMSVFIAGFCIANLIFGHAAKTKPPFRLVAIGTFVWIIAIFLSGLSKSLESFYLLLFARALSGVGEAAIQTVVPAFIDSQISSKRRSSALAIFYLGFPVGGALGFCGDRAQHLRSDGYVLLSDSLSSYFNTHSLVLHSHRTGHSTWRFRSYFHHF